MDKKSALLSLYCSVLALLLIFSGILKIINPDDTIEMIQYIFNQTFGLGLGIRIILILMFIIILIEMLVGICWLLKIYIRSTLFAMMFLFFGFTLLSLLLIIQNYKGSCGCFGSASPDFGTGHLIFVSLSAAAIFLTIRFRRE